MLLSVAVVAGMSAAPAAAGSAWQPRPAEFDVITEKDVPIPMSDGVSLSADVLRPGHGGTAAPGRFPVLVAQTAYNKNIPGLNFADEYLVQRGYVQIIVDARGTGSSPGTWSIFDQREQLDGKEIVDWAAAPERPWSDGRIGLVGSSYGAVNQLFTAAQHPAGLKAIFPVAPGADLYRDMALSGGQVGLGFLPMWLAGVDAAGLLPPADVLADPARAARVVQEHLGGIGGFEIPTGSDVMSAGATAFDGPFWRVRSPINVIDEVRVPAFLVGGTRDLFQRSTPALYQRLSAAGVPTRMFLVDGYHIDVSLAGNGKNPSLPGGYTGPSLPELQLRWFDHYVRGEADPGLDDDIAPVGYYEIGSGTWQAATTWPPAGTSYQRLSLTGSSSPGNAGQLTDTAHGDGGPDLVPWNPLSGFCSGSLAQWTVGIAGRVVCDGDQRLNDATGLSYDLPVDVPLHLTGTVNAHLTLATSSGDGQVAVRLEDVAPDGSVSFLTAGWQTLSLRELDPTRSISDDGMIVAPWHPYTRESSAPMPANVPVAVDIEIFPTAAVIQPGHRLRLAVQTMDFPHLIPTLPQLLNSLSPGLTLLHDPQSPSWITIPVRN
ncbi:CocE/NonD family hydrolase [Nocardia sp. NPDC052566]|uniref:CocE/NonD family hydrolase n=1 Tax=Nocardia sp. NPDC052566 TaxID=3364330 RepID=UPI0037C60DDD